MGSGDDVVWLIETGVFPRSAPAVIAALEARGVAFVPFVDGEPASMAEGRCVLFWGSLGAAYEQRVAARWRPGAIGDPDRFRCSVYQAELAPLLANAGAVFTTVAALVADAGRVLAPLGSPARVFVRPDSALKPFAGRQLATAALSLAALDHGFYYDDEELPIVVSTVKRVGREWRFVVADGAVVAGGEYGADRQGRGTVVPDAARAIAAAVASGAWQAAPLYVVDVGEVAGDMRVMELNPFSGADLYECDAGAVVAAATAVAVRMHGERLR